MPIPPRPIPSARQARPGKSVPRKTPSSLTPSTNDWRSELAFLDTMPKSLPTKGSGVTIIDQALASARERMAKEGEERKLREGRRVEELDGLVESGARGRVKKATIATSLDFDFIPNPSILALPDSTSSSRSSSSLPNRPHHPKLNRSLASTPNTPSLLAQQQGDEEDSDELSDWEHVPRGKSDEDAGSESEEDVIVLGELELEDEFERLDVKREERRDKRGRRESLRKKGVQVGETVRGRSYAAAVGR